MLICNVKKALNKSILNKGIFILCLLLYTFTCFGQVIVVGPGRDELLEEEEVAVEAESEPELENQQDQQLQKAKARLEAKLLELEESYGVFDSKIAENLFSLGQVYHASGEHQLARDTYTRSLEVTRVNYGLYNDIQFPIVKQLIILNRILGEWSEVDDTYDYLYWLSRRVYGENSELLLPVLESFVYWKYEAIMNNFLGNNELLMNELKKATRVANQILKTHPQTQEQVKRISRPLYSLNKMLQQAQVDIMRGR